MKVALVHDYLREYGGAERVLEVLHEIFPEAPLYTAYYNPGGLGENGKRFKDWDIKTSWFQYFPFANQLLSPFRIFGPMMFESFDLSGYDLVISSSATHLAKSVITKPGTLHISYIHTPPRFLYGYTTSFNYKKRWWTRIGGEIINHVMRMYDFEVSQRPDILIANSKNVASRIKKFYRRESVVIYPPVSLREALRAGPPIEIKKFEIRNSKFEIENRKYFLSLGRLVRGKGTEVIVESCTKLGVPLKVAGSGPELENLKSLAGVSVEFLGWVSDEKRLELLSGAKALILASEDEDFGITSIEAQWMGTPVIAPASGGYLETVIAEKTGEFYGGPGQVTVENLLETLKNFDPDKYKTEDCIKQAQMFSKKRFKEELLKLIKSNLKDPFQPQGDKD
ncbi:glycosyltransferase [Candidatus Daviesbacteria bacterium]|nr:glycosyltransferase [Candidatus Daviesbacteria bacterium]